MGDKTLDIVIAGGGYVGLSIAVALRASSDSLSVTVIDAAPAHAVENDLRASAIAAAARRMLQQLQIWEELAPSAQPIRRMIVTDSRLSDVARPVFLTFGELGDTGEAEADNDPTTEPFAHMVPNRELVQALRKSAERLGVDLVNGDSVEDFQRSVGSVELLLKSGARPVAKLLVAADGVRSRLRELANIRTLHWPYKQMGIVATVSHERSHEGCAEEHFLPAGPFAILPLKGNRSSLVWTERTDDAQRLLKADRLHLTLELEKRFGHHLGKIELESEPRAYPLGLTLARDYVQPRFALAGDAAHGIHPIAGQGLNLGFKDAAALAEVLVEAHRLGMDIGDLSVLEKYQMWRRFDTVQMGVTTDLLNRLFSNDIPFLRMIRGAGLGMVDRLPGLKRAFIEQAAGNSRVSPRLLQGNAI